MRLSRWVKSGVIVRMFRELHAQNILHIKPDALMMDSTTIKVHPDAYGALKKAVNNVSDALKVG